MIQRFTMLMILSCSLLNAVHHHTQGEFKFIPTDQTRSEICMSAFRAGLLSGAFGVLHGLKKLSLGEGLAFTAGTNFVIGNIVFQERNIPVQIVMCALGYLTGYKISYSEL